MSSRETFQQMQQITGMTTLEIIEMEKSATASTIPGCDIDSCQEDWHWCATCEYHLEEGGSCVNCC